MGFIRDKSAHLPTKPMRHFEKLASRAHYRRNFRREIHCQQLREEDFSPFLTCHSSFCQPLHCLLLLPPIPPTAHEENSFIQVLNFFLCHAEGECGTVLGFNMCISSEIGNGIKRNRNDTFSALKKFRIYRIL